MAESTSRPFPTNLPLEAEFTRAGWKFKKEAAFPLVRLVTVEEVQVRGVTDRADPVVVNEYANAMQAGAELPAGVVAQLTIDGKLVETPVDIHHRAAAALKVGRATYPVYILSGVEPIMLKAFALRRNRGHGKKLSTQEALAAVGELVNSGMAVEEIVRGTGLQRTQIERAAHAYRFMARVNKLDLSLSDAGLTRLEHLGQTARADMSRKLEHEPVFKATVQLVIDSAMNGTEATALTKQVAAAKSDEQALALLNTERSVRSEQIARIAAGFNPPRLSPVQQFRMHAGALLVLHADEAVDRNPESRETTRKMALDLYEFVLALVNAYGSKGGDDAQAQSAAD